MNALFVSKSSCIHGKLAPWEFTDVTKECCKFECETSERRENYYKVSLETRRLLFRSEGRQMAKKYRVVFSRTELCG